MTAARVSEIVSPWNSLRPVNISNRTTPKDQMSARRSTALPFACSGLMYEAVPRITPATVPVDVIVGDIDALASALVASPDRALASPKSSTLTWLSGVNLTLAGLRSRWITPESCAASNASAICRATFSVSCLDSVPRESRSERSSPSISSIAMKRVGAIAGSAPAPVSWIP
jgi:hypothetical protein